MRSANATASETAPEANSRPAAVPITADIRSTQPGDRRLHDNTAPVNPATTISKGSRPVWLAPSGPNPIQAGSSMAAPVAASIITSKTRLLHPWRGPASIRRMREDRTIGWPVTAIAVMLPGPWMR